MTQNAAPFNGGTDAKRNSFLSEAGLFRNIDYVQACISAKR